MPKNLLKIDKIANISISDQLSFCHSEIFSLALNEEVYHHIMLMTGISI